MTDRIAKGAGEASRGVARPFFVRSQNRFVRVRGPVLLAVLLACSLLSAAYPAPASARSSPTPVTRVAHGNLSWHSCDGSFRCASLPVPVVYGHPSAGTIDLSVVEFPSTSAHPVGDLVMNPGGPGASGVQFLESSATSFPTSLRAGFNLVSFDPRGIGSSAPLSCGSAAFLRDWAGADPAPSTAAAVGTVVAETKSFVAACRANSPRTVLDNVGTFETVQDMDRLRAALGQSKLTYLGFSYGTYLGEIYAQKYPTHIRALVLDGAINPALGMRQAEQQQADGFEQNLRAFFSWCAGTESCNGALPPNPTTAYERLFSRLASGAQIRANGGTGDEGLPAVNLGLAEVGVIASLYTPATWPALGQALAAAIAGDGSIFSKLALEYEGLTTTSVTSNIISANTAINCEDSGALGSISDYESLARQLARTAPDFGASEAWGSLTCLYWGVAPSEHTGRVEAKGAPPILVVGGTEDPATPYSWAQAVAKQLPHGVLLTRTGYGHTSYFASTCVRAIVDNYLTTLATPRPGTVCPSG